MTKLDPADLQPIRTARERPPSWHHWALASSARLGLGFIAYGGKGSSQEASRDIALGVESEVPASPSQSSAHQLDGSGQEIPFSSLTCTHSSE